MDQAILWTLCAIAYLVLVGGFLKSIYRSLNIDVEWGPFVTEMFFMIAALALPLLLLAWMIDGLIFMLTPQKEQPPEE